MRVAEMSESNGERIQDFCAEVQLLVASSQLTEFEVLGALEMLKPETWMALVVRHTT
jgi:hypothetical protein